MTFRNQSKKHPVCNITVTKIRSMNEYDFRTEESKTTSPQKHRRWGRLNKSAGSSPALGENIWGIFRKCGIFRKWLAGNISKTHCKYDLIRKHVYSKLTIDGAHLIEEGQDVRITFKCLEKYKKKHISIKIYKQFTRSSLIAHRIEEGDDVWIDRVDIQAVRWAFLWRERLAKENFTDHVFGVCGDVSVGARWLSKEGGDRDGGECGDGVE